MARKRLRASWIKKSANGWAWQRGSAVLGEVKKLIAVSDTPQGAGEEQIRQES
jgi:hypothetical protein